MEGVTVVVASRRGRCVCNQEQLAATDWLARSLAVAVGVFGLEGTNHQGAGGRAKRKAASVTDGLAGPSEPAAFPVCFRWPSGCCLLLRLRLRFYAQTPKCTPRPSLCLPQASHLPRHPHTTAIVPRDTDTGPFALQAFRLCLRLRGGDPAGRSLSVPAGTTTGLQQGERGEGGEGPVPAGQRVFSRQGERHNRHHSDPAS